VDGSAGASVTEWWTYRLSDFLMFSPRTYWRLVENYNRDLWPLHAAAALAGAAVLAMLHGAPRNAGARGRWLAALLALAWWVPAGAFLGDRYADIYLGAPWLAAAFALQGLLFAAAGVMGFDPPGAPPGREHSGFPRTAGIALAWAGIVAYPSATAAFGLSRIQMFGLMPDATALATLGVVLAWRPRARLAAIPLLATLSGGLTWWAIS
jgi:hypothetical protein